uniref:Ectonucleoside triphosphate diphosphohydrolase 4 n=1 Tax=Junco hyemalis TaxID=40217 RepID=A0A8C5IM14_JUNHY
MGSFHPPHISCLLPASWHFSLSPVGCPRVLNASLRQLLLLGAAAAAAALLLCSLLVVRGKHRDGKFHRYLARVRDTEATDTGNPNLSYGIVVDCGSSGSRVFVYCWPRHNGNPKDLLDIQQMRDSSRKPVVMKIKPGTGKNECLTSTIYKIKISMNRAELVQKKKKRKLKCFNLLSSSPSSCSWNSRCVPFPPAGVYAWIGINFVLGRFEHTDDGEDLRGAIPDVGMGIALPDAPIPDPCLPRDAQDELRHRGLRLQLRGTGDFQLCRERLRPLLNRTNGTGSSLNGVSQPPLHLQSSEFYGFSEFYYCTEDVLRMGGDYSAARFTKAAQVGKRGQGWLRMRSHIHKFTECFKSAWMFEVFHRGFSFPESYGSLKTALQVYDKEVQWTLGAILYRTRFLPLSSGKIWGSSQCPKLGALV